jgi:hypothetical protein
MNRAKLRELYTAERSKGEYRNADEQKRIESNW